jgi:hypothetical protein
VDIRKLLFVFFVLFYYSPQVLALAGFYNPLFLLFLLPLPSIGRLWLESRAYGVSIAVRCWENSKINHSDIQEKIEYYTDLMAGPSYYFTMPIRPIARKMIHDQFWKVMDRKTKFHQELFEIITNDRSR